MQTGSSISRSLVLVATFCMAGAAGAQMSASFSDPFTGVRFHYPANWRLGSQNSELYLSPNLVHVADALSLIPEKAEIRGVVVWEPANRPKTTLAGLQFLYAIDKTASAGACTKEEDTMGTAADTLIVKGMTFRHSHAEDAAMCHHVREDMYATYRNNACYRFDLSVRTICPGVVDGMRDATSTELAGAQAKLMAILQTVTIGQPKNTANH
jgi:hypothetical protein